MISAFDARQGKFIVLNGEIYQVVEFNFIKMQQRKPVVRLLLKSIRKNKVIEQTFPSDAQLEEVTIFRKPVQLLYKTESAYVCMDMNTYEEIIINKSFIEREEFVAENALIYVMINEKTGEVVGAELPPTVNLKVIYTEKGVKGDTATSPTKPATVETNYTLQVPLFIEVGDIIQIDTTTGKYVERVKTAKEK